MNILVTGASKGIGYQLVKLYADNPNNNIVALARDFKLLQKLKKECQNNIHIYSIDFLADTFQSDFSNIIKQHKLHYDIIVNNAGYLINQPFLETTNSQVQEVFQVNVYAPIFILQTLFPILETNKGCHVINIGSMGGYQGSSKFPGLSIYSASKSALANLTECLAEEFSPNNITINCLALGSVQTEMLNTAFPGYKAQVSPQEIAKYIADFSINGQKYFNGKIIPIAKITP